MPEPEIKKLYYSIREVSELTGIEQHVLRYWETEFSRLRPKKNRGGKRQYRRSDIDLIQRIKNLLYVKGYKIDGARRKLQDTNSTPEAIVSDQSIGNPKLNELKQGLIEIQRILDS